MKRNDKKLMKKNVRKNKIPVSGIKEETQILQIMKG